MSENASQPQQNPEMPIFKLQKLYIKDFSFENPNAPEIFLEKIAEPKVDLKLGLKNKELQDDHWEVCLSVTADLKDKQSGKTLFIVEVEHAGIFLIKNIPDEHMPLILSVECPVYLLPFTRQLVCQATVDGGYPPFLMEPVNFHALYNAQQEKNRKMS